MLSKGYACQILMKIEFSWQIFKVYSDIKFHYNSSIGSQVVPCGLMDSMMKLIVAFRKFVNVPKNLYESHCDPVT